MKMIKSIDFNIGFVAGIVKTGVQYTCFYLTGDESEEVHVPTPKPTAIGSPAIAPSDSSTEIERYGSGSKSPIPILKRLLT
jgi:hypothetical protein